MTADLDALAAGWRGDPAELVAASDDHEPARRLVAMFRDALTGRQQAAACRRHPDVDYFDGRQQRAALDICGRCPVLTDCRHWAPALDPPLEGCVVAGLTPAAVRLAYRNRRRTPRGYPTRPDPPPLDNTPTATRPYTNPQVDRHVL